MLNRLRSLRPFLHPWASLERKFLFFPERTFRGTPEHVDLEYEDIFPVTSDDVKLHGWHIPVDSEDTSDTVWLIFHGNGGNIGVRLDQYEEINYRYEAPIIAIDYRGYGRSEGEPSEQGMYIDAMAAFEMTQQLHPGKKIVVFGRSLGGPVAAQLASMISPAALILEASISSLAAVMRERAPWIQYSPLRFIIRSKFETTKYVSGGNVPTLILHGDSDRTVSPENAHRIFDAASNPRQLHIVKGGDHDGLDLVESDEYHEVLSEFLDEHEAL
jgi:hypothetical protein